MSSEIQRLRDELKRRRAAVSNKISRIRRENGAEIAGTQFDPRRKAGIEKRYNKAQLQRHIAELNTFMNRGNQFVGGDGGAPIRRGTWNVLQRRMAEVNSVGKAYVESMANIPAPLMGVVNKGERGATLGETRAMLHSKADSGVKGPYQTLSFQPSDIAGESAAKALADNALKQLKSNYLPGKINEGRENLKKALTIMGEEGLVNRVNQLSDNQFDVLWFGSAFAEITFMKYDIEQARSADTRKEKWQDKMVDNAFDDIGTFLDWATNLPDDRTQAGTQSKKKR